jgi:hypothetical protein
MFASFYFQGNNAILTTENIDAQRRSLSLVFLVALCINTAFCVLFVFELLIIQRSKSEKNYILLTPYVKSSGLWVPCNVPMHLQL